MSKKNNEKPTPSVDIMANSFQAIIENANDFVAIITSEGQIIHVNESGRFLLTLLDEDEIPSLNISDLIAEVDRTHFQQSALPAAIQDGLWQGHLTLRSIDGMEIPTSLRIIAQPDAEGNVSAIGVIGNDITDRKWMEDSLQESESRFRSSFENTSLGMALVSLEGSILQVNAAMTDLLGYDQQEFMTKSIFDLVHSDDVARTDLPIQQLQSGELHTIKGQVRYQCKDGATLWGDVNATAILDANENPNYFLLQIQDITEQKQSEEALREREALLQLVLDTIPQAVFWKDKDFTYLGSNKNFATDAGLASAQDLIGKNDFDLPWQPEEAEAFQKDDKRVMEANVADLNIIESQLQADGKQAWLETNKVPLHNENGEVIGILGTYDDITDRMKLETEIKEREALLQLVLDTIPQAVFWKDKDFTYLGSNKNFATDAGLASAQDLIGKNDFDLPWQPEEAEAFQKDDKRVMEANVADLNIIEPQLQADGKQAWLETNKVPLHNENDEVIGILGTYDDITDRIELQNKLQETLTTQERQVQIGQALASTQTEQEVLDIIIEKANYYPNAALSITYWETDAQGERFDIVARQSAFESGLDPLTEGTKTAWNQSPMSQHYSQEELFISNNLANDERLDDEIQESFSGIGIKGFAILPMVASGEWLGNMAVMTKTEDFFTEQVISLYRSLAEQGSIALRGAQLFEETQSTLRLRSQEVALTIQIAQEVAAAPNLSNLYQRVVNQITEQFDHYYVQLLRYDPFLDTVALIYGYGKVGQEMLDMNHSMPLGVGLIGSAAESGQTTYRSDITTDPDWQANPLLQKTKSEIAVPIKLGDEVLGILDVQSDHINAFNENDQLLLEGLCGQIAVAIESTRLREEMDARVSELTTLQRYMSREGWESYREDKADAQPGYHFDHQGVVALVDELELAPAENGEAVAQETAVVINKRETALTVLGGEVIGKISVEEDQEDPLSDEDLDFIESVSAQVAEALEAARLFEQTQDALGEQERLSTQLETVAQVSTAASTMLEVDALLQAVVDLTKASFGLYHTHIYLMDNNTNNLVLRAGADQVGRLMTLEGRHIGIYDESIVARAVRNKDGIVENDVRKIIDFLPNPLLPQTRAELAVPLVVGDSVIGVLDLQADKVDFFTEEDVNIHRTLASQIAVAVQNASLFAEQVETSEKLREVDRLKSEFLASMSHELRTPLNSIIGFSDVLLEGLDGELNERMEEDVRLIRDSGRHLRELIGDILDLSKIESGRMEMRYEEVDMHQMGHDILANAAPLAEAKGLALHLNISDEIDLIEIDRTRIRQVLWNIMGNAIKFTEKGSVTLSMDIQGHDLLVGIHDTGIGIEKENISVVFEQFRQIDGNLNRSAGGTGLGMPITKKLVELHGGEIWIESVMGQGSVFWFTLPTHQYYRKEKKGTAPLDMD